ncbi:hypothetical protein lbkm_1052 [Lachnospiraceae bacterium KM106-2]|nr:hypothetical protein lbkm_1052 [Lachnospiraceae bacterium KM106-2]
MGKKSSTNIQLLGNTVILIAIGFYCNTNFNMNYQAITLVIGLIGVFISFFGFFVKDDK